MEEIDRPPHNMNLIQITELSLAVFAETILFFVFAVYLTIVPKRSRESYLMMVLFWAGTAFTITLFIALSFRNLVPLHAAIIPLQYFPVAFATAALIQIAYVFPKEPPLRQAERRIALVLSLLIALVILGSALYHPLEVNQLEIQRFGFVIVFEFVWAFLVLLRRYFRHLMHLEAYRYPLRRLRGDKTAQTYHALLAVLVIPIIIAIATNLRDLGYIPISWADYALSLGGLLFIFLLSSVYLNYSSQNSTVLINLTGYTLLMILILISIVGFVIAPIFRSNFENENILADNQTLRFTRTVNGGYMVDSAPLSFDEDLGQSIDFSQGEVQTITAGFQFPFYDQHFDSFMIHQDRVITFDGPFSYLEFRDGLQPGVGALIMDIDFDRMANDRSGIYFKEDNKSVTITWNELYERESETASSVQLVFFADGTIDMHLISHQPVQQFSRHARDSVWLIGIQSGDWSNRVHQIGFKEGLPFTGDGSASIVEDYHIQFRDYLHSQILPLFWLMIIASGLVIPLYPLLIRNNIIKPINQLVAGFEKVNNGNLEVTLPIQTRNELGYLTRAFNYTVASIQYKKSSATRVQRRLGRKGRSTHNRLDPRPG